jgi:cytoskeletal protein CcmA (bactofilin family)
MGQNASISKGIHAMKRSSHMLWSGLALAVCLLILGCTDPALHAPDGIAMAAANLPPTEAPADERHANALGAAMIILIFSAMLFLPFWPGLRESLWPRDEYPLPVNIHYSKDPRHLGNSFRRILFEGLGGNPVSSGLRTVPLSKDETVEVQSDCRIETGQILPHILLVQGDMQTQPRATFRKELYVAGSASIGRRCRLRSLACDGDVILGRQIRVTRWIDANGDIRVGAGSRLGVSCSCAGQLMLDHDVAFQRLFSPQITSPDYRERDLPALPSGRAPRTAAAQIKSIEDVTNYRRQSSLLLSGTVIEQDLVVKGDLNLADGVSIHGDVRCDGRAIIGRDSVIAGDLFAEGPIEILHNAVVLGNLFSQDSVQLYPGVRIGQAGHIKSIIAKKRIVVDRNVAIYGYVLTEGKGAVL